jgi:hypothetical protein
MGKGSLEKKVQQYEFNKFKNLLENDADFRGGFVSLAKNFANDCALEEIPGVLDGMKNFFASGALNEVCGAFANRVNVIMSSGKIFQSGREVETLIRELNVAKDLLRNDMGRWNSACAGFAMQSPYIAGLCTRENFSKVFNAVKEFLGEGSEHDATVRRGFATQVKVLAQECSEGDWPIFSREIKEALGEGSQEWKNAEREFEYAHKGHTG